MDTVEDSVSFLADPCFESFIMTPFQLQGFLSCYLSWAEQPFPPSPDEKTETQRDKKMRPTTGDQIRLADLCSKGLVLQVKQRKEKYSPFLSEPR